MQFWLRKAIAEDADEIVRHACADALRRVSVTADEVEDLRRQVANASLDAIGRSPNHMLFVNGGSVLMDEVHQAVKSAVWPHWPLYPQDNNSDWVRPPYVPEAPKEGKRFPIVDQDKM